MTDKGEDTPKNRVASVQARLRRFAQDSKTDYNRVLTRYANERFLYRLSQTPHGQTFVLKGATLFTLWTGAPHRNTGDLDFLGTGDPSPEMMATRLRVVLETEVPDDGLVFLPDSLTVETRRDEEQYPGLKVRFEARLGNMRLPVRADVGFATGSDSGNVRAQENTPADTDPTYPDPGRGADGGSTATVAGVLAA